MKVLVLGVTGMLGNAIFRVFDGDSQIDVWGTLRSATSKRAFSDSAHARLFENIDVLDQDALSSVLAKARPDVVVNCIGLIKQLADAENPLWALPINSILPHRLSALCDLAGARLIHVSTDCVFSGHKGNYVESDLSDAQDLYGKSKYIGEVNDQAHVVTLRTSIIGHELNSSHALIDWFLSQTGEVKGFARAVFSGLPTVEFARVIKDFVLPRRELHGLYHVAAESITKLDLLRLVAAQYGKAIDIIPDERLVINRSLNNNRFRTATGYTAPPWKELVALMHANQ